MRPAPHVALVLCVACSPAASPDSPATPMATATAAPTAAAADTAPAEPLPPLYVAPDSYDFSQNPALLERILSGPHGYFRFINVEFSDAVCERFRDSMKRLPNMNLHGDAHVEQYAVTTLGRGLTDFDDSSIGPGVLDLARFGVSIFIAAHERGWTAGRGKALDRLFEGYYGALDDPKLEPEAPKLAERLAAAGKRTRAEFLEWANTVMEPVSPQQQAGAAAATKRYAEMMHAQYEGLRKGFFALERVGRVRVGVGSALDEKYLLRVEGPTDAKDDDIVLEAKVVRDLTGIGCIQGRQTADPFRIMVGQSRIAYQPYRYLGSIWWRERAFWVHEWQPNYQELSIRSSLSSEDDLAAVAYDVGVQLGRGHPRGVGAESVDFQLRRAQKMAIRDIELELRRGIDDLAAQVVEAWERFRVEAKAKR